MQYSLTNHATAVSVFRRYSEFYRLRELVLREMKDLEGIPFPKKRLLRSCTPQNVENRRVTLETWLISLAKRDQLCCLLLDFLSAIKASEEAKRSVPNAGETIIVATIAKLAAQPHMRLSTLESFENEFFRVGNAVSQDFLLALIQKIVPLCGDNYTGCKAISILSKLISRASNRSFTEAIRALRSLPLESLREIHLERHLLKAMQVDTGEESFRLLQLLSQDDSSRSDQLVVGI